MTSGEKEYVDFEFFHPKDSTRHQVIRFELGIGKEQSLYTVLPEEICRKLGEPLGIFIQLISAGGVSFEVELWAVGARYKDRQCVTAVIPSKNKKTTLGFLTLAQLGLSYNIKSIKCFEDQLFNSLIYDYVYDIAESLYNMREALDVYQEVVRQYDEDWIDAFMKNSDYFLKEWDRSSFVVWFMSMYNYSLNSAIILLLAGLYPYVALAYRQALESLIAAYVADTRKNYTEIGDPLTRLDVAFEELEKTGFKNIVDKYFGDDKDLANEISSLWKELSSLFVHARGLLYAFPEVSSIAMGLPLVAYVDGDKEPLSLLNNCIRRFRKIFKTLFDKWSTAWGDG
jgi:tetratricopeptide (TPR) repeat protein